jgi:hypothetical protein
MQSKKDTLSDAEKWLNFWYNIQWEMGCFEKVGLEKKAAKEKARKGIVDEWLFINDHHKPRSIECYHCHGVITSSNDRKWFPNASLHSYQLIFHQTCFQIWQDDRVVRAESELKGYGIVFD